MSAQKPTPTPIAPTSVTPVASTSAECGRFVALDCEFVGVGVAGIESMLARVSMCNFQCVRCLPTLACAVDIGAQRSYPSRCLRQSERTSNGLSDLGVGREGGRSTRRRSCTGIDV